MSNEDPTSPTAAAAAPAAALPSMDEAIAAVKLYLSTHSAEGDGDVARRTRMLVYELVQAQEPVSQGAGAIYKDLTCGICTGLVGTTPDPSSPYPVTLTCGHMFCRGCVGHSSSRDCPSCRRPITVRVADLGKSAAVAEVVVRLMPRRGVAGGAGGGGPRRSSYRKSHRKSHRSSRRNSRRV